jgi:hypothetical protein
MNRFRMMFLETAGAIRDLRCGSLGGRSLKGGQVGVLDALDASRFSLLLYRLHSLERDLCIFGVAKLTVKACQQVLHMSVFVA